MTTISSVGVDHYRIPLPVVLSDSTHGDIAEFELVTVRVRDAAGAAGLGYTYTVGRGGAAVAALIKHDLCSVLLGVESRPCAIVLSNDAVAPVAVVGETALEPQKATHHIRLKQGPSPP